MFLWVRRVDRTNSWKTTHINEKSKPQDRAAQTAANILCPVKPKRSTSTLPNQSYICKTTAGWRHHAPGSGPPPQTTLSIARAPHQPVQCWGPYQAVLAQQRPETTCEGVRVAQSASWRPSTQGWVEHGTRSTRSTRSPLKLGSTCGSWSALFIFENWWHTNDYMGFNWAIKGLARAKNQRGGDCCGWLHFESPGLWTMSNHGPTSVRKRKSTTVSLFKLPQLNVATVGQPKD